MKNLKDILEQNGYQPPPDEYVDIPEWQGPDIPRKRWMTISDLFCGAGGLIALLGVVLQNIIAIVLWLLFALILLQILIGGCRG